MNLPAFLVFSSGHAPHEPGPMCDAPHARAAPLHATSRHDAATWHGTRLHSPRGDATTTDVAGTDGHSAAGE